MDLRKVDWRCKAIPKKPWLFDRVFIASLRLQRMNLVLEWTESDDVAFIRFFGTVDRDLPILR